MVELAHRGIDQGVAGPPGAPGGEIGLCRRPAGPHDGVVGRLEGLADHVREMVENHEIEISPDQLVQPVVRLGRQRLAYQAADRAGTETQMDGEVRDPAYGREVPQLAVTGQPVLAEGLPPR